MNIAVSTPCTVSPEVLAPKPPKQTKLLGATVKGIGIVTTVSEQNVWSWALIEDEKGKEHHVFIADLSKDMLTFPTEPQPFRHITRRIGYGLIESGYELTSVPFSDLTHVSPEEKVA